MNWREMLVLLLAFCFFAQTGFSQAKRRSTQRIPLDLVRLFVRDDELRGCLDSEYGGDIRKFTADLEASIQIDSKYDPSYNPSVRLVDLNGDNKPEYLINAPHKCAQCGSGGCDTYVYHEESNGIGYRLLLIAVLGSVSTEKTISNGFRDLLWSIGKDFDGTYTTYRFNGNSYEASGCYRVLNPGPLGTRQTVTCDSYLIRLFNCDDGCRAYINGRLVGETSFGEDTSFDFVGWLHDGRNEIKFTVNNKGGGIAYGIQVSKNDSIIFEKTCGRAGTIGCDNNRTFPTGVAREFTYTILK